VLIFFWLTLWAVKASLLLMFKKLTAGLPFYEHLWWYVMAFTIVTFIGCVISDFTSCSSLHAWFTAGTSNIIRATIGDKLGRRRMTPHGGPRSRFNTSDRRVSQSPRCNCKSSQFMVCVGSRPTYRSNQYIFLFYIRYHADTPIVMAIPIRLLWNLRISIREKIGLAIIFTVGFITMIFAIVRTVSLEGTTSGGQVSTQWLILWGAIEGMVAIIVGCLPSFAIFIRSQVEASRLRRNSITYPPPASTASPTYTSKFSEFDSFHSEHTKSRMRIESLQLDDFEIVDSSLDGDSRHSLVHRPTSEREVQVTRAWSQKWHRGIELEGPRVETVESGDDLGFI